MIVEKVIELKKSQIKVYPCYVNRASQIGEPCLRRLVYERTNYSDKRLHDVGLELIFEEGKVQEDKVLEDLKAAGFRIFEQQRFFQWNEYQISGHIDAMIELDAEAYPIEIKSMSPYIFPNINTLEDFNKYPWTKKYLSQMMIYLLLAEKEKGYFILKNKSTGELKEIEVTLDYEYAEKIVEKAEEINKHVAAGTLPDKINEFDVCNECPFSHICLPDLNMGEPIDIQNLPELEAQLEERERLQQYAKQFEEIDKAIKVKIKEKPTFSTGKWMISGKWVEKKEYTSPATKYWQSKIIKLGE